MGGRLFENTSLKADRMNVEVSPNLLFEKMNESEKYKLLQYKVSEVKLLQAWKLFVESGLSPILIKGLAAAQYYPKPFQRKLGDIDLVFSHEEYPFALDIRAAHPEFDLDLHCGLKHYDTVSWDVLKVNSQRVYFGESSVDVLCPEDHLRVLSVHWLNDGGADREKLWDIYYCIESNKTNFDWRKCLETVSQKRRRWIICAIGLAERYLPVSLIGTPFEFERIELPQWLCRAIEKEWASGVRLMPIQNYFQNPVEFFRQFKKRFPPNPIQAIVQTEGDFDSRIRFFYQIENFLDRTVPFFQRLKTDKWRKS